MMNAKKTELEYATDFSLPAFDEAPREPWPIFLPWEEIIALFEEQRLAYMRDFYTPESRLENKVPEQFSL